MDRKDRSRRTLARLFLLGAALLCGTLASRPAAAQTLIYADGYEGCTGSPTAGLAAWTSISGTPISGEPDDTPDPVARYAGRCAMRADAPGDYVTDESPAGEPSFSVLFHVYTGFVDGSVTVLRARTDMTLRFEVRITADSANATIELLDLNGVPMTVGTGPVGNWYTILVDWDANAPRLDITLRSTVTGTIGPLSHPNPPQSADSVDDVDVGWIAGTATVSPAAPDPRAGVLVDAYESRRFGSLPAFLLPGDADGNGRYGASDLAVIQNEAGGASLAAGTPDCDEDGLVEAADADCVSGKAQRFRSGME